jgi:hypothetical protein
MADFYRRHIRWRWLYWQNNRRINRLAKAVARQSPTSNARPVIFFNASTRLGGLSLNAAFQLLTAWLVRLQGVPVVHFACRSGLVPCPLGTDRDHPTHPLSCRDCLAQSFQIYRHTDVRWLAPQPPDPTLEQALQNLSTQDLSQFTFQNAPLGQLVLPTLRWALRRHHLADDEDTRFLLRGYILSAWRVIQDFSSLIAQTKPQAVVVFNGMFYPEAAVRYVAVQHGLRVITHEVGFQPFSAFFTDGEATAYPVDIPMDFMLSPAQNQRLDAYLARRFQGDFSMAGIRFWPSMHPLSPAFLEKAAQFKQVVPVFTNVIFDTSQPHSNVVFDHMFAWLDLVLEVIRQHPETLFVIRAHPDESRPGKQSCESVRQWVQAKRIQDLPNAVFIDATEPFSSYELIQRAKFVMVYNSTIGLEAALLGAPVLCGGRARFTRLPTVFFPNNPLAYQQQAEAFLSAVHIDVPSEFRHNARRFLYYQLYRTCLPFEGYLMNEGRPGFVLLRDFTWESLVATQSPVLKVVAEGLLEQKPFLFENE